jgi:hypothetical protein
LCLVLRVWERRGEHDRRNKDHQPAHSFTGLSALYDRELSPAAEVDSFRLAIRPILPV